MGGPISVYNTLTREKQFLQKAPGEAVSLYVCGPTVYDDPHIGHLRSAYVFDVIRRTIETSGHPVTFVRNVTDVDDKIIDRADRDGTRIDIVAAKYLDSYHRALRRMGIAEPTVEPKATDHIAEMISMIQVLIGKGLAYVARGSVYFRVRSLQEYGRLSHQKIDEILQNTRVEAEEGKEDDLDFALWKTSCEDEPFWESPWGKGRPGWHIECSAMSGKYLGDELDIHGGGRDLLFPHHENERAQSIGATGKRFAKIWVHHGLITIHGQKMAKSLGNFVALDDVLKRGHTVDTLKLFFLQSHYRSDVDFTWEKMKALDEALQRFGTFFAKVDLENVTPNEAEKLTDTQLEWIFDDFDTPRVLAGLFAALNAGNAMWNGGDLKGAEAQAALIRRWGVHLGLFAGSRLRGKESWRNALKRLVEIRNEKKKAKEYKVSDWVRNELVKLGFKAEDGKDGLLTLIEVSVPDEDAMSRHLSDLLQKIESMS